MFMGTRGVLSNGANMVKAGLAIGRRVNEIMVVDARILTKESRGDEELDQQITGGDEGLDGVLCL